jgi:hypothetical protein
MAETIRLGTFSEAAPYVAALGLGVGGLSRGMKHIIDALRRQDPEAAPVEIKRTHPPITDTEVEVTPEEAEELARRGVHVKKVKLGQEVSLSDVSLPASLALGALGTGAVIGGWKLSDFLINKLRQRAAQSEREKMYNRVHKMLEGDPESIDVPLHASMKAAEDIHFDKKALAIQDFPNTAKLILAALGGVGVVAGMSAYQKATAQSKYQTKIKALKDYLKKQQTQTPIASIEPVLGIPKEEEKSFTPVVAQ